MADLEARVSYLLGLADGLQLDHSSKEGRFLLEVVDVLGDVAREVRKLQQAQSEAARYMEELDQDLGEVEEWTYLAPQDRAAAQPSPAGRPGIVTAVETEAGEYVEVHCPNCGETVHVSAGEAVSPNTPLQVICPNCGEEIYDTIPDFEADVDDNQLQNQRGH